MEGCIYPLDYKYSKFLFYTSFLIGLSFMVALYFNNNYISIYLFLLFLSSINFWRKPKYGLRRNIDRIMIYIGSFNILYYIFLLNSEFNKKIILYLFICIIFFNIMENIYFYLKLNKWIIFHMAIHIYVFIMSLFMFII